MLTIEELQKFIEEQKLEKEVLIKDLRDHLIKIDNLKKDILEGE